MQSCGVILQKPHCVKIAVKRVGVMLGPSFHFARTRWPRSKVRVRGWVRQFRKTTKNTPMAVHLRTSRSIHNVPVQKYRNIWNYFSIFHRYRVGNKKRPPVSSEVLILWTKNLSMQSWKFKNVEHFLAGAGPERRRGERGSQNFFDF